MLAAPDWDQPFIWLAVALITLGVGYGLGMLIASRRQPRRDLGLARNRASGPELFFVFMMPCLNEESVLLNSLNRLLSIPEQNFVVMVIDDDSNDRTVEVASGVLGERVWLLRRKRPDARLGKGEALNAAIRHLMGGGLLDGLDPSNVITVVVDADGRLDEHAVGLVAPYFNDPSVGAVQIGVRINNRSRSRLARMQDMEFVVYTEIFQRGRRHLGSVGLGGNGQFVRLSALLSLGASPWTRSLTDDLDLGVRLIAAGWRIEYCPDAAVHQQGVVELRRLIRQRSRWFQGHLQSWRLVPLVLRAAPRHVRTDLLYHLTSPATLLIASLLTASFAVSLANIAVLAVDGQNPVGWWIASTYGLAFGPALIYGYVYWTRERAHGLSLPTAVALSHLFVFYGMIWYASGWWAVGRTLRGRTGWAKTDRVTESPGRISTTEVTGYPTGRSLPAAGNAIPAGGPGRSSTWPAPAPGGRALVPPHRRSGMRHGGRRRTIVTLTVTAAGLTSVTLALVVAFSGMLAGDRHRREWLPLFNGYGETSVTGSGPGAVIMLSPRQVRSPRETHAALVVSAASYTDFAATLRVQTLSQARYGPAGKPNPWEVAWVLWHYTSNDHFYALTLKADGWILSKQDAAYPGAERFLASGKTPQFRIGATHSVRIVQAGDEINVSADGHELTRFADQQQPYLRGALGLYTEDAVARFDRILVHPLPAEAYPTGQATPERSFAHGTGKSPHIPPARQ